MADHDSALSGAARRPRSEAIRDVGASRGMLNGVLLAGIAQVETGLSHCWSEATWACQGPFSSYCSGPVIAGAGDGPCSEQQGGLGMFQFDGGTYAQTLARDGTAILQLDGNISHAVDFVAGIVREELGLASNADAVAWINTVPPVQGNARFAQWTAILACRYNGRCSGASQDQQAALYGNATISMLGEFGAAFWDTSGSRPRVVVGDVGGDGRGDLLGIKPDGTLWYYRNTATSVPFTSGTQIGTGWTTFDTVVAGDVSGDGYADLLGIRLDGTLRYYRNAGAANPDAPYSSGTQIGTGWTTFGKVLVADVSGDGYADLLGIRLDGTLWYYRNAGAANPDAPYSSGVQIGTGWTTFVRVVAGDVNGDGYADLVGIKPDGSLWYYANSKNPSQPYSSGTQIGTGWTVFNKVLAVDLTGDGFAELVGVKPDGTLWSYLNSASPGSPPYGAGVQIGTGWTVF